MTSSLAQIIPTSTAAATQAASRLGQSALAFYNVSLLPFEIFSVLISIALIVGIVLTIARTGWFATRVDRVRDVILKTDMPKKRATEAWEAVQRHFFSGNANDLKMAIVQADNILSDALRYAGVRGSNLGDRLKNIKRGQIPNLEDIWAAHKLRNEIAHETSFVLKRDTAERALEAYETALKNLGAFETGTK
jgi:hypothetical protein